MWQTPQDWLNRRSPSLWESLNDASGAWAKAGAVTARAATRTLNRMFPPLFSRIRDPVLECDLTPCGGRVKGARCRSRLDRQRSRAGQGSRAVGRHELRLGERREPTACPHQLVEGAGLDDAAVLKHEDAGRVAYGGEP